MEVRTQYICCVAVATLLGLRAVAQSSTARCGRTMDSLHTSMKGMVRAQNGDVMVLGEAFDPDYTERFVLLQRFDQSGTAVTGTLHHAAASYAVDAAGVVELGNGDFLAVVNNSIHAGILRFDPSGQLIDARAGSVAGAYYRNLVRVNDTTVLGLGSADGELLITRFDPVGDPLTSVRVTIDGLGGNAWHAIPSADGGYWVDGGGYDEEGAIGADFRTCLLRFDAGGQLLWAKRYIAPGIVLSPFGLVELPGGAVLIGGSAWHLDVNIEPFLLKVGAQGDPLFMSRYRASSDTTDQLVASAIGGPVGSDVHITAWSADGPLVCVRADTSGASGSASTTTVVHAAAVAPILLPDRMIFGATSTDVPDYGSNGLVESELPFELPCGQPTPLFIDTLSITVGAVFAGTPFALAFNDDVTGQFTPVPYAVTLFDPCLSTAVQEDDPAQDPVVWPVPAQDRIHVRGSGIQAIELIDAMGRVVAVPVPPSAAGIDIGRAAPGLCHLRLVQHGSSRVIPFIKE